MDYEKLKKANSIKFKIEKLEKYQKVLEWGSGENFEARPISINILGTSQSEGFAEIPKSISKNILQTALLSVNKELADLKSEFESL